MALTANQTRDINTDLEEVFIAVKRARNLLEHAAQIRKDAGVTADADDATDDAALAAIETRLRNLGHG